LLGVGVRNYLAVSRALALIAAITRVPFVYKRPGARPPDYASVLAVARTSAQRALLTALK
jgi:hypothetical protein